MFVFDVFFFEQKQKILDTNTKLMVFRGDGMGPNILQRKNQKWFIFFEKMEMFDTVYPTHPSKKRPWTPPLDTGLLAPHHSSQHTHTISHLNSTRTGHSKHHTTTHLHRPPHTPVYRCSVRLSILFYIAQTATTCPAHNTENLHSANLARRQFTHFTLRMQPRRVRNSFK